MFVEILYYYLAYKYTISLYYRGIYSMESPGNVCRNPLAKRVRLIIHVLQHINVQSLYTQGHSQELLLRRLIYGSDILKACLGSAFNFYVHLFKISFLSTFSNFFDVAHFQQKVFNKKLDKCFFFFFWPMGAVASQREKEKKNMFVFFSFFRL